jgi:hypothetical protein
VSRQFLTCLIDGDEKKVIITNGTHYEEVKELTSIDECFKLTLAALKHVVGQYPILTRILDPRYCVPLVQSQMIYGTGLTYPMTTSSKAPEEKNVYEKIYESCRPMLFLKGSISTLAQGLTLIGVRSDVQRTIPEAELVAVFNVFQEIIGYTLGNDQTAISLEKENPLYQFQGKCFTHSTALLPLLLITDEFPHGDIELIVMRNGTEVLTSSYTTKDFQGKWSEIKSALNFVCGQKRDCFLFLGFGGKIPPEFKLEGNDTVIIKSSIFPWELNQKTALV